jgi:tetratricopeptide (TPR) repeat protein
MIAFAGMFHTEAGGRDRSWSVIWFGVLGVVGAGIAATGSRGATLAAAAAAGALLVLRRAGVRRGSLVVAVALSAAALALAVLPVLRPGLIPAVGDGLVRSAGIRWQVYEASARAALDAAPAGVGLGGFAAAFTAHRPSQLPYSPRFAHNETLHGVVELGIPFLVAVVATGLLAARRAVRGVRAGEPRSLVSWGAVGALLAAGAHAQIDFALRVPAIALAAATLAGFAWRELAGPRIAPPLRWSRGALTGLAAVLAVLAGTQILAVLAEQRSQARLVAGDFGAAEVEAQRGLRVRPGRTMLLRRSAEAAEHSFELGGGGRVALERALLARRAAAAAASRRADLQVELAATLWKAGERPRALVALDRAVELDPASPGLRVMRSRLLLGAARRREAALALRDALERHPVAALDAVEALLRATDDPQLAQTAVPEIPRAIVGAGRALVRAGYPRDAAEQFQRALALRPADAKLALETARSLRAAGDPDRATAVLSRTLDLVPGDAGLELELERLGARTDGARDRAAARSST